VLWCHVDSLHWLFKLRWITLCELLGSLWLRVSPACLYSEFQLTPWRCVLVVLENKNTWTWLWAVHGNSLSWLRFISMARSSCDSTTFPLLFSSKNIPVTFASVNWEVATSLFRHRKLVVLIYGAFYVCFVVILSDCRFVAVGKVWFFCCCKWANVIWIYTQRTCSCLSIWTRQHTASYQRPTGRFATLTLGAWTIRRFHTVDYSYHK